MLAADNNPHAAATYQRNFPGARVCVADLSTEVAQDTIIREARRLRVDTVIGGPPCQGFSTLNHKKQESLYADGMNKLPEAFIKIAIALNPSKIVMEEVKTVPAQYLDELESRLRKAGYSHVSRSLLNAKDYGVPQNRNRVFLVATKAPTRFPPRASGRVALTAGEALRSVPHHDAIPVSENQSKWVRMRETIDPSTGKNVLKLNKPTWHHDVYGVMRMDRPSPTITTKINQVGSGRFALERDGRYYTPTVAQAAALQSFPSSFKFEGPANNHKYRQVGNSVPPRLAYAVAKSVI